MTDWNLADCLDTIAAIRGDRPAIIQGSNTVSWQSFENNATRIADWFSRCGVSAYDQVALYTYNHIAYLEASYGCLKASFVPVNINYRYKEEELLYLFNNSDAQAVVIHSDFLSQFRVILPKLPKIRAVLVLDGEGTSLDDWPGVHCRHYDEVLAEEPGEPLKSGRSGDDMIFIYTGGTTGMPKGVMWRQKDLYQTLAGGTLAPPPTSPELFRQFITDDPNPLKVLILPPLMHGTAFFSSIVALLAGGTVVLSSNYTSFDAGEVWSLVEQQQPNALSIVGDTFSMPLLNELRSKSYDISSLEFIASAGALWSNKVKAGLLEYHSGLKLFDGLGSSEAHNIGTSITTADNIDDPIPRFSFGSNTLLVSEDMKPLDIVPGAKGMIAVGGARPVGYYKDTVKSDQTFIIIDGRNCTLSGDWAEVNEDGESFTLLGRGSVCINTGGEKVFPEEVEGALKQYEGIVDVVVVGLPDERWGEIIVGVVSTEPEIVVEPASLIAFVKGKLANYKSPKHIVILPDIYRSPAGKADYAAVKKLAAEALEVKL
ncbi:MAG: AMP-binding protein [Halioglobus sp.]